MIRIKFIRRVLILLCLTWIETLGAPGLGWHAIGPKLQRKQDVKASREWRDNPALCGISLDLSREAIIKTLDGGYHIYSTPDYVAKNESRYQWKRNGGTLEVGFDQYDRTTYIGFYSQDKPKSIGGISLNKDTFDSIKLKLGTPNRTDGPSFDEGLSYCSIVYFVGLNRSQELHFVSSVDWDASNLDPAQITESIFAKRPIHKVFIIRRPALN